MRIRALMIRIIRQFLRDRRTLALMLVAPLLILTLMSLIFNGDTYVPKIGISGVPGPVENALKETDAEVENVNAADVDAAKLLLQSGDYDAVLLFADERPQLVLEGSDPSKSKSVMLTIQTAFQKLLPASAQTEPSITYLYGSSDLVSFDWFGPVLIGVFSFFFVFLIAGIAFLRERTGGTLERIMASPMKRTDMVLGYVCGFGIFTLLQAGLIAWFSVDILGMLMVGSFGYVLLITALLALTALSLGILLSAFAANEFQMMQFIPLVIVPQVFFSGLFPLETIVSWLRVLSYAMPLTYGADALRTVMVKGGGWSDIAADVYVLVGFSLAFMLLNVAALKKYRSM
ncbi:ABC transporter permease [Paenibacillus thermotolerans]|uniref:ABC transporter permease n=1 Tax=Paenibacillus thermotolerans TaxID=3027807 RepID=UPI002367F057|nr:MULTISPECIES: ABC transporter permease [unclassified Paenibacillus]